MSPHSKFRPLQDEGLAPAVNLLHMGNIKQPLSEQVVCENEAAKWTELWNESGEYSILDSEWNDRPMLPNPRAGYAPLTVQHLRAAIRTFLEPPFA